MRRFFNTLLFAILINIFLTQGVFAQSSLLSPEEKLWLETRNNTIVVYPEKNDPPFSYQTAAGSLQGLSIDYIELIAEKVGAKIQYLTPRSRAQIVEDVKNGKGDVILNITSTKDREDFLLFTESYITTPAVIVVRKDTEKRNSLTLTDYTGKRIAVVDGSASLEYIRQNYPRVVTEDVSDDEVGLQKVVLGEVDAAVMDVTSLSYLLSKQVLTSVKIGGNTGLNYEPSFAVSKDKALLQSILEKGLSQISSAERETLTQKWVSLPNSDNGTAANTFERLQSSSSILILYFLFGLGFIGVLILIIHNKKNMRFHHYFRKREAIDDLKGEINELEDTSRELVSELEHIKEMEQEIKHKLDDLKQ